MLTLKGLFQKKTQTGVLKIFFSETHLQILALPLLEILGKKALTPGNSVKLCDTTWKSYLFQLTHEIPNKCYIRNITLVKTL